MKVWYSCKVKSNKEGDDGMLKQVTEAYLVDAVSYTDAESRIYEAMEVNIAGEFSVTNITKTNISEVVNHEDADYWYKSKVTYSTIDGDSEKEVKINSYYLVSAENVKQAYERIEASLNSMLVPFEIPSVALSPIVEIFPYERDEEKIPDNLKPLSEVEKDTDN